VNEVPLARGPVIENIHTRRCARHNEREAAARCPSCGGFFCRECIVEHEGRLLCTTCLARQATSALARSGQWAGARRHLALAAATLAAVLVFYAMGSILLSVPPEFHEGTIWSPKVGRPQ
jgi:late competence protein required for DNA uptake (superfamily II DNA/RNA helicase)